MSEAQILALSLIQTESNKKSSNVLRTFRRKSPAISIATQNSKLGKELNIIEHILTDLMPQLYKSLSLKRKSVFLVLA